LTEKEFRSWLEENSAYYNTCISHTDDGIYRVYTYIHPQTRKVQFRRFRVSPVKKEVKVQLRKEGDLLKVKCPRCGLVCSFGEWKGKLYCNYECEHFKKIEGSYAVFRWVEYYTDDG